MRQQTRASLILATTLLLGGVPSDADTAGSQSLRIYPEKPASWWNSPNTIWIDVRAPASYRSEHLPGAIHLRPPNPVSSLNSVRRYLGHEGISGEETLVLYGNGDTYGSLAEFFWWLERAGCAKVRILEGGIEGWRLAGQPLESGTLERHPVQFSESPSEEPLADLQWVLRHFGTKGAEIIDVRESSHHWALYHFSVLFREGHIPHSLPYNFSRLHGEHGVWLADGESARKEFAHLGPRPQDHIRLDSVFTLYGNNPEDVRPKVGYLILRMLGVRVKIYSGGWEEWSRQPNPVVRILGAEELHTWLENQNRRLTLIDLRIQRDYDIGHIPGALSVPAYESQARFESLLQGKDAPGRDEPLVFYCYGVECIRSRNYSTQAARLGFRNLYWFREGYPGWKAAGFPIVRNLTTPKQ